ncbi:FAD-dependent oxidoreductase [Novosphingobium flavum]|uniref:Thioredoxin reductase n=1 Tax=Novosphingobium flavum TaxID=1778672 RepID=A0A7X1FS60_9SPHN|nr:NAD(P)/FAD-dependent oxidoreductase [Novosphingobium flavum]MBC2665859.1 FAD-dependent oxidoreductase [Novosphingobium flavum]
MDSFDVVIVGQGYAGLKAAALAGARGLKVNTIEQMMPGGLVMSINDLEPGPDGNPACGPELTGDMAMTNMDSGIEMVCDAATSLEQTADGWVIETGSGPMKAKNVILATGGSLRKLGVPGEAEFEGRGVSSCADCDGPIYGGKDAVVIGSGDAAFQEANALTHYVAAVTVVMRGDAPKARAEFVERVNANPAITVLSGYEVTEIVGDKVVSAVKLKGADGSEKELPCAAVFAFVGIEPATELAPAELERDAGGAIVTADNGQTSLPGLYAVGAVRSGFGGKLSDADVDAEKVLAAIA